ncbi:beta-N-acetylhexosaminidase [Neobacillus mesonae]|uniref:beta-N-acetylhexosaminidase n=1 Tax=Neobacillus mesonae TaxID=1193713 RepID=UPI0008333189|nr:beta-N-acetylhexosaminidase [Neobacillus mesonae]
MYNKKAFRLKGIIILILLIFLALTAIYATGAFDSGKPSDKVDPKQTSQGSKKPEDSTNGQPSTVRPYNIEALVKKTFSLSKEGKVVHAAFISGKSNRIEVNEKWGKPNHISQTARGKYEEYDKYHVVFGYAGEIVNDIRSYVSEIQSISLNEIKKAGGEPDQVRYYQDATNNQIILVYHVTKKTDLLWILPKPTGQDSNPKVDHISVFTQVDNQPNQHESQTKTKTISEMSLEEKIGQMILAGISGTTVDTNTQNLINQYKVGGIIFYQDNLENPVQTLQLVNQIKSKSDPKLPLLLSVDQEGGRVTRLPGGLVNFPPNKSIGEVNNPEFSYKVGTILGQELKAFGLNLDFAPVLDINSNPKNPVIGDRSFGNNSEVVSRLGIQTMKGIQSQDIITTIKHFPGHGDTSVDSHLDLPIVNKSLKELKELELIPFERAINNGADVVMVAHILLPQLDAKYPASMSKAVMTDILRNQLGFKGVIITDDMTMGAIIDHFDIGQAAVKSVNSGSDIILVGHDYNKIVEIISSLKKAVLNGEISEQRINDSVSRILVLKNNYGINNEKVRNVNIGELNKSITNLLKEYSK